MLFRFASKRRTITQSAGKDTAPLMPDSPYAHLPLSRLLLLLGRERQHVAHALGVSAKTLDRWAERDRAPRPARLLLEVLAGFMPWPGFECCEVKRGAVYVHDLADGMTPAEIAAAYWQRQRADSLARELDAFKRAPAQFLLDV